MFYLSTNIIEIDLSKFDFSKVTTMNKMFMNCSMLEKIEFGDINTSSLISMEYIFNGCSNLKSIDLSKFNTNKVTSFQYIFNDCKSITSIALGNMDTSSAKSLNSFFNHCENLKLIDISSFNTSLVVDMTKVFFHCYLLKLIAFPFIFDTSKVTTMYSIFSHCSSLIALDLSNFYLSNDVNLEYMFHNCNKLKYIDLSNFPPITVTKLTLTFRLLKSLVYLNIPNLEINSNTMMERTFADKSIYFKVCANQPNMIQNITNLHITNDCSNICFNKNIKIGYNSNECITSCKEKGYDYEYLNICFHQCPEYTHAIYQNNINNNALICLDKNPEGYYLDNDGFYKKCFESCKFCNGEGNEIEHNCKVCKSDYYFFDDSFYKNNCYQKCPYYYYNDENKYICTDNCSGKYNKLIINTNKCVNKCENDKIYKYEYNKICYGECQKININKKEGICFNSTIFQFINISNMEIINSRKR